MARRRGCPATEMESRGGAMGGAAGGGAARGSAARGSAVQGSAVRGSRRRSLLARLTATLSSRGGVWEEAQEVPEDQHAVKARLLAQCGDKLCVAQAMHRDDRELGQRTAEARVEQAEAQRALQTSRWTSMSNRLGFDFGRDWRHVWEALEYESRS